MGATREGFDDHHNILLYSIEKAVVPQAQEEARKKGEEPIPDFRTRFPNKLESCLSTPFQSFGGEDLYPNDIGKAAVLPAYQKPSIPKWQQVVGYFDNAVFLTLKIWHRQCYPCDR